MNWCVLSLCWVFLLLENSEAWQIPDPPPWAAEAAQTLEAPSSGVYTSMTRAWQELAGPSSSKQADGNPRVHTPEERDAMRQIVAAREKGTQALVWMYLDEQSSQGEELTSRRQLLLSALRYDPEIAQSMRVIAKARLSWLAEETEEGRYSSQSITEILSLVSYLQHQGRVEDLQPLEKTAKIFLPPHPLAGVLGRLTAGSQKKVFDETRTFAQARSMPHWRAWADVLIRRGYETESSLGLNATGHTENEAVEKITAKPQPSDRPQ